MEQEGNKDQNPALDGAKITRLQEQAMSLEADNTDPVTVTPNQATQWPLTGDSFEIGIPYYQSKQERSSLSQGPLTATEARRLEHEAYLAHNRFNDPNYRQAAQEALRNRELSPEQYKNMFPNDLETLSRMRPWAGMGQLGTKKEASDKNPEESNLIDPLPKVRIPLTPVNLDSLGINSSQLDIAQRHVTESNRFVLISMILLGFLAVTIIFMASKIDKLDFNLETYRQDNLFLKSHNKFLNEQLDAANLEIFKLTHKEQENAKSK